MWAQLGLAALKSMQDENNRKQDIASNVITQKYSPWTGARADFSSQAKNNVFGNLAGGVAAGLAQKQIDAINQKTTADTAATTKKSAWADDAAYYGSAEDRRKNSPQNAIGYTAPMSQVSPSRAPAVDPGQTSASSFKDLFTPQYSDPTPLMLQANPAGGVNPWEILSKGQPIQGKDPSVHSSDWQRFVTSRMGMR